MEENKNEDASTVSTTECSAEQEKKFHTNISSCTVKSVTVYRDRAEVHRTFQFIPTITGEIEVKISSLTLSADPESIRVKGCDSCSIMEVSHDVIKSRKDGQSLHAVKQLSEKSVVLEKRIRIASQFKQRLQKQRDLTQSYAERALCGRKNKDDSDNITLKDAKDVLLFHQLELETLDEKETANDEELNNLTIEMKLIKEEMNKLYNAGQDGVSSTREISIILNVSDMIPTTIGFSYVVSNATWAASYDIRVNTITNTMDIQYYAEVIQKSGEDWVDVILNLSTSNPAIGSSPPELKNKTINFQYNTPVYAKKSGFKMSSNTKYFSEESDEDSQFKRKSSFEYLPEEVGRRSSGMPNNNTDERPFLQLSAVGPGDAGSTLFTVQRAVTVASDSKPHRVTVTIAVLQPQMVYCATPSISAFVYLQAKAQNTSFFPFLASDKVSVFLDNNFISTTSLLQANSGEYFNVYLGVDPGVKVEYMPCRTVNKVKGWMNGVQERRLFYSTVIHNTKQHAGKIIIVEQLPHGASEKIVVELLDPAPSSLAKPQTDAVPVRSEQDIINNLDSLTDEAQGTTAGRWPRDFISLNKHTNHVVWLKTVPAGEKVEVKFTYRVSWPMGQNIDL